MRNRVLLAGALLVSGFAAKSLVALEPPRALTQYVHDSWATDQGLPQATVRAIVQTRDGYLWVGTEEGLARFDGVRFTVFNRRTVPAFRANHVLSLLEDHSGDLWVGTHGGGVMRYRSGIFTTFRRANGLASDFAYSLHEEPDGTLWIGGRRGVAQFRNGRMAVSNLAPNKGTIWSIEEDRTGVMWLGTDLYGLTRIVGDVPTTYTTVNGLPHDSISVIRQLKGGRIIIGTNGRGLYEWSDGRFVPFRAKGTLPSGAITALLEDSAGNLWIGTNAGLARATNGVISTGAPGDLASSAIQAIVEDREGNLWIGTSSTGLHRLRPGKVRTLTTTDGLPSDRIQTVFHDREGRAWIGTRNGVARIADGAITTYSTRNGLPNDSVQSLFQSSDGAIWLGTDLGGVVRMTTSGMHTTILDPEIPDNTVRAFAEQAGVGVWVGTNGGPLTLFTEGGRNRKVVLAGMRRVFVRAMAMDGRGSLWVATDGNGLLQVVDGEVHKLYTERDGLSRDSLRSLYVDADDVVWIGTDGGGLNRLQNGKITVYGTREGLFDDVVLQILEGTDGRLWMSCNNGIFAVDKGALDAYAEGRINYIESFFIDDRDGMPSRDCSGGSQPAGARSSDGKLWFPTDAGVVIVDPQNLRTNPQPPPVYIEKVVTDGTPVTGKDDFEIPRGTKNLEISYTALSLVVPERVRFRYKLEGYDDKWTDAGARRTAYYTAPPPGRYRFHVIAANDDGLWNNEGAHIELSLQPYFYQRRSFALLVLAMLAASIWAAVALRIRYIRREAERAAEMERRFLIVQRMDALGQMASGIAHDFNNTLMAAYPWAELIQREYPDDPRLQRAAENISNAVDRAKRVTRQFLDFAQPKQPEVTPVDLGQVAGEALSMARAIIPPEIDVRLTVDPTGVVATADEAKIGQVLMNLILNASDAMPNGGSLSVDVRHPTEVEVASWNLDREKFVLLSVQDNGAGIEPKVLERIFDPFFTTKGVGKGTGLGLAVAHRIVQDHHGSIHVESVLGKGTTFHILLPKADRVLQAAPMVVEAAPRLLRGTRTLLIDDEMVIVEIIRDMLQRNGASVDVASSGPEALRLLDEGMRPDVVVLDLGLPEMSGERVHALIRQRMPDLPIIISSGYGDRERLDPLLRDPNTFYFQKPYRIASLIERIVAVTQREIRENEPTT